MISQEQISSTDVIASRYPLFLTVSLTESKFKNLHCTYVAECGELLEFGDTDPVKDVATTKTSTWDVGKI